MSGRNNLERPIGFISRLKRAGMLEPLWAVLQAHGRHGRPRRPHWPIIPAALGVWAVYWCMRLQAAPAQTSCPQSSPSWPFTSFLPQRDMDGRVSAFARPEHDGEGEIKC